MSRLCATIVLVCLVPRPLVVVGQAGRSAEDERAWLLKRSFDLLKHDPDSARYYAERGRELAVEAGDSLSLALAYKRLGVYHLDASQYEEARSCLNSALVIDRAMDNEKGIISTLQKLATLEAEVGRLQDAHDLFSDALARSEKLKDDVSIARCCGMLAPVCSDMGLFDRAIELTYRALDIRKRLNDREGIMFSTRNLASLFGKMQRYEDAVAQQKIYIQMQRTGGAKLDLAGAYVSICGPLGELGRPEEELSYADSALRLFRELQSISGEIMARTNTAGAMVELGRLSEAEVEYRALLDLVEKEGTDEDEAQTLFALGSLCLETGRARDAEPMFRKALTWCRRTRNLLLEEEVLGELARCLRTQGRLDEALGYFTEAKSVHDTLFSERNGQLLASAEMREKYDADQREGTIKELRTEIDLREERERRRTLERNMLILASIALLAFLALVGRNLQHRKKLMGQQQALHEQRVNELLRQQEIRSLEAMLEGQEKERGRIAQDLHDRLGSMLSAIKMQFSVLEGKVERLEDGQRERYQKVYGMLDEAVSEVRRVSHDMARGALSNAGLGPALRDLCETLRAPGKLDVELDLFGMDDRLDQRTEIIIYRIIQELVSNVLKHAKADRLSIQVTRARTSVNVIVEDNGVGFDPMNVVGGLGLSGARARAAELGGVVHVDPKPGHGTSVTIDIPLANA